MRRRLLRLDLPGIIDPGVDGVDLPAHDLVFREVLVQIAEDERGKPFTLEELFFDVSDDTMVEVLGGRLSSSGMSGGGPRAHDLATRIRERPKFWSQMRD